MQPNDYSRFSDSGCGVYPPDEFKGLWVEHWPNGILKFRGEFRKNGMKVGQHICFWENGALSEVSHWREGWVCGTLISFREDGSRQRERYYGEHGGRNRFWVERFYDEDSELYAIYVWKNEQIVSEWASPEELEMEKEIDIDRIVDEAVRQVYPDE